MSYLDEGQALVDQFAKRNAEIMKKYEGFQKPPGQLDGEPWDKEMRASKLAFTEGLKALREKYPDWQKEIE